MANASQVYAYLDLPGNFIKWTPANNASNNLVLDGSGFIDVVPMATLAISALCLLCFIVLLFAACVIRCSGDKTGHIFFPWYCGWLPLIWMVGFFGIDLGNRIVHELRLAVPTLYVAVDVPLGSSSTIADGLLMIWLLNNSPVNTKSVGDAARWWMVFILSVYALIGTATKGVQVWTVITQITPPDNFNANNDTTSQGGWGSMHYYNTLGSSAIGIQLLFAICYAIFAARFIIRRLETTDYLRKRLAWIVAIITTAFIMRNAVALVFTLIYSQYGDTASDVDQLIYLAFYGIFSVVIFTCIILIAHASRRGEGTLLTGSDYVTYRADPNEKVFGTEVTTSRVSACCIPQTLVDIALCKIRLENDKFPS